MKPNKKEIIEKLKQLDSDMALIDSTDDLYTCVIVGGSALVLMDKIYRSTHDIDSIASSEKIQPLLEAYNINMNDEESKVLYCFNRRLGGFKVVRKQG